MTDNSSQNEDKKSESKLSPLLKAKLKLKQLSSSSAENWLAKNRSLVLRQTPVWAQSLMAIVISLATISVAGSILFKIDEVVFFDSEDIIDFQNKIEFYSLNKDEAKRIAKKGWERGHKDYNERIVTNYFLDIALHKKPTKEYSWPVNQFFI